MASRAAASASAPQSSACWTWASFLLYPSFYLRVGSAKATAPSKASKTMAWVLMLYIWSNLRVKTQMSLIYDFDVTIFSNDQKGWFSKWVIPNYCITFLIFQVTTILLQKCMVSPIKSQYYMQACVMNPSFRFFYWLVVSFLAMVSDLLDMIPWWFHNHFSIKMNIATNSYIYRI